MAHGRFAVFLNFNVGEYEGGCLRFPEFGQQTYQPPTGGAIVVSCSLLHEATPITQGRRYAYLPFLYNDADPKIRQANQRFLETTSKEATTGLGSQFLAMGYADFSLIAFHFQQTKLMPSILIPILSAVQWQRMRSRHSYWDAYSIDMDQL
jgi:hypothetical protein